MTEQTFKDTMLEAALIADDLSDERSERIPYCYCEDEAQCHKDAAEQADKMAATFREMARSYVVIFYGEDGEPCPWCVQADNARHAVERAWGLRASEAGEESYLISEAFKWLHGVYPGFINPRVARKELEA